MTYEINKQYCNCQPMRTPEDTSANKYSNKELEKEAFDELHKDVREGRLTAQQADAMGAMVKAAINMQGQQKTEQNVSQNSPHNHHHKQQCTDCVK